MISRRVPLLALFMAVFLTATLAVPASAQPQTMTLHPERVPARTQMAVLNEGGSMQVTGNAHEPRAALSTAKVYLAYWVLKHGDGQAHAHDLRVAITHSDNAATERLERAYPQAIPSVIRDFNLRGTTHHGHWGTVRTTPVDLVNFISAVRYDPDAAALMDAMRNVAPTVGSFRQDFATHAIPGVEGTKFGWFGAQHAGVSFGNGWVAASNTFGSARDSIDDVSGSVTVSSYRVPDRGPMTTGMLIDATRCADPTGSSRALPRDIVVPTPLRQPARDAVNAVRAVCH